MKGSAPQAQKKIMISNADERTASYGIEGPTTTVTAAYVTLDGAVHSSWGLNEAKLTELVESLLNNS